jgi:hypothetical protein
MYALRQTGTVQICDGGGRLLRLNLRDRRNLLPKAAKGAARGRGNVGATRKRLKLADCH